MIKIYGLKLRDIVAPPKRLVLDADPTGPPRPTSAHDELILGFGYELAASPDLERAETRRTVKTHKSSKTDRTTKTGRTERTLRSVLNQGVGWTARLSASLRRVKWNRRSSEGVDSDNNA